jgi:PIN domain nuclease of toxin-antitoxin system
MIVAIADTPAVIWYLYSNPRLGKAASSLIDQTSAAGDQIGLSGPASVLRTVPLHETIAARMIEVPRDQVPDLPDRIIGATALFFSVPVLSRDDRLRSSTIRTV